MTDLRAFCMPKWGIEMTEGTLAEWMVSEGDAFKKGDLLCLIETDKITNEVEAEKDGVVERIVVKAGGDAEAVGSLLAVLFAFDAICGEKERGTLKVMLSNAVPRDLIILSKGIGGYLCLIVPFLVALLAGTDSIREVIAFPKSGGGYDPLTAAPAPISPEQRKEAGVDAKEAEDVPEQA